MGKGDHKSRRGKIHIGMYGHWRVRKHQPTLIPPAETQPRTQAEMPMVEKEPAKHKKRPPAKRQPVTISHLDAEAHQL